MKAGSALLGIEEGLRSENYRGVRDEDDHSNEDDEDEEYSSSDEEDDDVAAPKLKPVFVRATDRITLQAKKRAEEFEQEAMEEAKRLTDERRRDTLKVCLRACLSLFFKAFVCTIHSFFCAWPEMRNIPTKLMQTF